MKAILWVIREPCVPPRTNSETLCSSHLPNVISLILFAICRFLKLHLKDRIETGSGDSTEDASKKKNVEAGEDLVADERREKIQGLPSGSS